MTVMARSEADPFPDVALGGTSHSAPSIVGDDIYGMAAVWEQNGNVMFSVGEGMTWSPPIQIQGARSFYTPGIAIAYDWFDMAIVWTDVDGQVSLQLASSPGTTIALSEANATIDAPSIVYGEGILYIAWISTVGTLTVTTYTQDGPGIPADSDTAIISAPNLCWYQDTLYACVGGTPFDPVAMSILATSDGGITFDIVDGGPTFVSSSPPIWSSRMDFTASSIPTRASCSM